MRQDDFVNFMRATICKFEQSNSYGTAHIYKNSLSNLIAFYRTDRIPFKKITPELLKGFEFYLRSEAAQLEYRLHLLAHNPGNL